MNMKDVCVCIMAGGVGSRFWPASREAFPKQFLDINGKGESLLQQTIHRFEAMGVASDHIWIITNDIYTELIHEQVPQIPKNRVIGEPMRKNTAAAALLGTLAISKEMSNAPIIMSPVDHHIGDESTFAQIMKEASDFVRSNDVLLTIGIQPTEPHTGYGYINFDDQGKAPFHVKQFTEKPNLEHAKKFLEGGEHLWNAGIFLWNADFMLKLYADLAKEMVELFDSELVWNACAPSQESLTAVYEKVEDISIDYKILEKCDQVFTLPGSFGWSDMGSWKAVYDLAEVDENKNFAIADQLMSEESTGNFVNVNGKLVIIKGLENYMVVEQEDVLMICPIADHQEVKKWRNKAIEDYGSKYK